MIRHIYTGLVLSLIVSFVLACQSKGNDLQFKGVYSPLNVGNKVAERYVSLPFRDYGTLDSIHPTQIIYPEVCAWLGALRFAEASKNKPLLSKLEKRYAYLISDKKQLLPVPNHVDNSVFGCIPLELYQQTHELGYYHLGMKYADTQWNVPKDSVFQPSLQKSIDKGLSWQTRFWIDDMYMISMLQLQAYGATKNKLYLNRAAKEMVVYLDSIQQPNGLFYHAGDVPFYWGRGNGWMAAGMAELLRCLSRNDMYYQQIMPQYKKMMHTLRTYQKRDGLWGQLIDDTNSWSETSGSGMFLYAMIIGVKQGWLDKKEYIPVIRKGWTALVKHVSANGDVLNVCQATNKKNNRQYYLDRKCYPGDLHGQAVVLWCATELVDL